MTTHAAGDNANFLDVAPSTSGNKYALLMVPDYDNGAAGNQTSYVSLGATQASRLSTYSEWAKFRSSNMGTRDHTDGDRVITTKGPRLDVVGGNYEMHVRGAIAPTSYDTDPQKETFRDEDEAYLRLGYTDKDPYLPLFVDSDAAKKAEIEGIVRAMKAATSGPNKFGWEDHTDGHRMTTTGGDKIEIIKGKSYIHVLGADDFDVSEGQKAISRSGSDPQAPGYSAAQNNNKRPMMISRTWARRSITETWLGLDRSTPTSKLPTDDLIALTSFPEVVDGEQREYTYATNLKSYTGSSDARVEHVYERTYAKKIESETGDAGCWVDDIIENTHVHRQNSTTTADAINERTLVKGAMASTTLCPFVADTRVSVASIETSVDGFRGEFALGGLTLAIEVGGKIEITGPTKFRTEISVPKKVEVDVEKLETRVNHIVAALTEKKVALAKSQTTASLTLTSMITKLGI